MDALTYIFTYLYYICLIMYMCEDVNIYVVSELVHDRN